MVFEGQLVATGLRFAIVVSRFNGFITERLLAGARDGLLRHGAAEADVDVAWVPGALEIAITAQRLAASGRYAAVLCVGAVIRGATPHFDYVCAETAKGVATVALQSGVPCVFGVLTTNTIEEAIERAGTKAGNKGYDTATAAIEMATLLHQIDAAAEPAPRPLRRRDRS